MSPRRHYAPNPSEYWETQAAKLMLLYPELYRSLMGLPPFDTWHVSAALARQLCKILGNPYGYQPSTFVSSIKAAARRLKRTAREKIRQSAAQD